MDAKDAINYSLSSLAFIMSMSAFLFAVVFQRKERKRNIRQTLTSTLNAIAGINVELSKLKQEDKDEEDKNAIRKNYNSQRSILITDADFLIHENAAIVTSIDCALMATTYNAIGQFKKADHFWGESIHKSDNNTGKHFNKRDYASFLFNQNEPQEARRQFKQTLNIKLSDTDDDLRLIIDTYLIWAKLELAFGNEEEFKKLVGFAAEKCLQIKHKGKYHQAKTLTDSVGGEKQKAEQAKSK